MSRHSGTQHLFGGETVKRERQAHVEPGVVPRLDTCVSFGKCTINQSSSSIEHLHTAPTVVRGQPLTSAPSAIAHHRRHVDASLGSVPPPAVTTASLQHPSVRAPLLARSSRSSASSVIVLRLRRRVSTSPPCPGAAATASATAAVGRASGVDGGGGGASKCSVPTASMMQTIALRMVLGAGETRGGGRQGGHLKSNEGCACLAGRSFPPKLAAGVVQYGRTQNAKTGCARHKTSSWCPRRLNEAHQAT